MAELRNFEASSAVEPYRDKRSLYLGDSFTLGWGVTYEESYVGLLAEKMPPDRSILNAGYTAGWSPDSYYAYLVKNHSLLGIDEVKIFLNHTDVDDVRHNRWLETDDYGGPVALKTIRRLVDYRGSPIDWSVWTETASVRFLRDSAFYRLIVSWPTRGADWEMGWDPEMEPEPKPFDRLEQALRAMDAFCRDQDLRLSFVLVSERWHSGHKDYDLVMTAFRKIVASLDRPLLDLSPHLDQTSYYIPNDGHLNAAGSRVAAEAIWNHIVSEALLDP